MTLYSFDPITDKRWRPFLAEQTEASVFHTGEWLEVLRSSYGYRPVAFTTMPSGALANAVVFCEVRSWLTGSRLVSLPFSDHCQPLANEADLSMILLGLHELRLERRLKYVELRPRRHPGALDAEARFSESESFTQQTIDLSPDLSSLYNGFHASCVRRKIKRADREGLVYESGRSQDLLDKFRLLLLLTRRRHRLPPQPTVWFQNIVAALGENVTIHVLSKGANPIASILTLSFKKTLVYKYGCSDAKFSALGATPALFWKVIEGAKLAGMESFDLGRSDTKDPGLQTFKEHLGATSSRLTYFRDSTSTASESTSRVQVGAFARSAIVRLPDPLFSGVGQLLYRHLG